MLGAFGGRSTYGVRVVKAKQVKNLRKKSGVD
jgi:hypothetical protein